MKSKFNDLVRDVFVFYMKFVIVVHKRVAFMLKGLKRKLNQS